MKKENPYVKGLKTRIENLKRKNVEEGIKFQDEVRRHKKEVLNLLFYCASYKAEGFILQRKVDRLKDDVNKLNDCLELKIRKTDI